MAIRTPNGLISKNYSATTKKTQFPASPSRPTSCTPTSTSRRQLRHSWRRTLGLTMRSKCDRGQEYLQNLLKLSFLLDDHPYLRLFLPECLPQCLMLLSLYSCRRVAMVQFKTSIHRLELDLFLCDDPVPDIV